MLQALDLKMLNDAVKDRYQHDEQRVVGIMLARYDIGFAKAIVKNNYQYWHYNTGRYFDVFWAGYGEFLCPDDESPTKKILNFAGNKNRVYFDLEAFIKIKKEIERHFNFSYNDNIQLLLVNYRDGSLKFDESVKIQLEKDQRVNSATVRSLMEYITKACMREHDVAKIRRELRTKEFKKRFGKFTVVDALTLAATIIPAFF